MKGRSFLERIQEDGMLVDYFKWHILFNFLVIFGLLVKLILLYLFFMVFI